MDMVINEQKMIYLKRLSDIGTKWILQVNKMN